MTTPPYTCDTCLEPVAPEAAFVRSVNLRTTAWCHDCWFARHPDLGQADLQSPDLQLPAQRGSARGTSRRRRALLRR